jgi:hypothetical protein
MVNRSYFAVTLRNGARRTGEHVFNVVTLSYFVDHHFIVPLPASRPLVPRHDRVLASVVIFALTASSKGTSR